MVSEKSPAVFLDRDGTLMHEVDYCSDPRNVVLFGDARESLLRLRSAGFRLIIITNQSGIGRGYFTVRDYENVQAELLRQIHRDAENLIDATYFCPDAPDIESARRKPSPAMVLEAANHHRLDLARSFFIGDKMIDVECGHRAGTRSILVKTGHGAKIAVSESESADFVAENLTSAVDWILRHRDRG